MPEGPEVRTIVDTLNSSLKNTKVIQVEVLPQSKYASVWVGAQKPQVPFIIQKVSCKGKQIYFHLDSNRYLYSHLIMTGKWLWKEGKYTHVKFHFEDGKVIYYDDSRKWGHLEWLNQSQYEKKLQETGPDLLAGEMTLELWKKLFSNKRLQKKQVCDLLMSQKHIAGIGNYLKAEILYRARIRPDRVLSALNEGEIVFLYETAVKTIKESYLSKGLTIATYETPDGSKGSFKLLVYDKKSDHEGNKVVTGKFKDNRTTHWVPAIQK